MRGLHREAGIPVLAVPGNHEYRISPRTPSGIEFEMRGLRKGERRFETMDRFGLPWAEAVHRDPGAAFAFPT